LTLILHSSWFASFKVIELKDMLRTEVAEAVPSFELGLAYTGTVAPQLMTGVHWGNSQEVLNAGFDGAITTWQEPEYLAKGTVFLSGLVTSYGHT